MKEKKEQEEVGFFVPKRELNWMIALGLLLFLLAFLGGYFWGHRRAVGRFLSKVEEESFADRITYSLYTLTGKSVEEEQPGDVSDETEEETAPEPEEKNEEPEVIPQTGARIVYAAPLVGFGTLHAANSFVQRVHKMGIEALVKERSSRTQRGRKIVWYQIMTQDYSDKTELEKVISELQQKERIKDIKIIEKRKANEAC